jgi:predicted enzyme related to lactoylglutathione lyase
MSVNNVIGWFEIPVSNMERAITFYNNVFGYEMERQNFGGLDMAFFPFDHSQPGNSGSLVKHPDFYHPSENGVLIYFTGPSGDLSIELARVNNAGGKVLIEKRQVSEETGYMGVFLDSEGNRIAIHTKK